VKPGIAISEAEVSHVSRNGIWVLLPEGEFLLPFEQFPWFETSSVAAVLNVQRLSEDHLYWPDLDVDLSVASIREPANFPLIARTPPPPQGDSSQSPGKASKLV